MQFIGNLLFFLPAVVCTVCWVTFFDNYYKRITEDHDSKAASADLGKVVFLSLQNFCSNFCPKCAQFANQKDIS